MSETWPPEILKGIAPENELWAAPWIGCLSWACQDESIIAAYQKDTGDKFTLGRSPIERMIDKATGADVAHLQRFVRWFNKNVWGPEGLPEEPHP